MHRHFFFSVAHSNDSGRKLTQVPEMPGYGDITAMTDSLRIHAGHNGAHRWFCRVKSRRMRHICSENDKWAFLVETKNWKCAGNGCHDLCIHPTDFVIDLHRKIRQVLQTILRLTPYTSPSPFGKTNGKQRNAPIPADVATKHCVTTPSLPSAIRLTSI